MNTWSTAYPYFQQALTVAALIGAIWSAFTFVKSVNEKRRVAHAQDVATWRKASLHRLLHNSQQFMPIAEITNALRSASFDVPVRVEKSELSEDVVRLLVLEMLEAGTIRQLWGDRFGISHFDFSAELAEWNAVAVRVCREAFEFIFEFPRHYTTERLHEKVAGSGAHGNLRIAVFRLMLAQLVHIGAAYQDSEGNWFPLGKGPLETPQGTKLRS